MLNEQNSNNNLCQLPKYIKFWIFTELNPLDLLSISQTCKSCYQTYTQDDFWLFKVGAKFI